MAKKKQDITDIFVKHRKLTLGVKIVSTFAFTYYLLYFILLTVLRMTISSETMSLRNMPGHRRFYNKRRIL